MELIDLKHLFAITPEASASHVVLIAEIVYVFMNSEMLSFARNVEFEFHPVVSLRFFEIFPDIFERRGIASKFR